MPENKEKKHQPECGSISTECLEEEGLHPDCTTTYSSPLLVTHLTSSSSLASSPRAVSALSLSAFLSVNQRLPIRRCLSASLLLQGFTASPPEVLPHHLQQQQKKKGAASSGSLASL